MIRNRSIYLSAANYHRLRLAAEVLDLANPEEALDVLIERYLPSLVDVSSIMSAEQAAIDTLKAKLQQP